MAQPVGQGRGGDGSQAVRTVPCGHADGLLSAPEPLGGDDAEQGQATALEQAQEEARNEEVAVALTRRHGGLSDAPSKTQRGHEDAVRHPHDEV